jgi:hypothetical protein
LKARSRAKIVPDRQQWLRQWLSLPNFGILLLLNISPGFSSTYYPLSISHRSGEEFLPQASASILAQKGDFFICQKLAAALPVTNVSYYYWSTWVALVSFKGF